MKSRGDPSGRLNIIDCTGRVALYSNLRNKKRREFSVVLFLLRAFEYVKERFVFFATVRTSVQVVPHERHQSGGVLLVYLSFHVLIKFFIELVAGDPFGLHILEHTQKSQNRRVGKLLGWAHFVLDFSN